MADPPVWSAVLESVTTAGTMAIAVGVAVVEARRANAANKERDALLAEQNAERHRSTAKLVSSWVEQSYTPNENGTAYVQQIHAHIINESNDPVFNVEASIYLTSPVPGEHPPVILGSLSIPRIIPILPPRRELIYDLTLPLMPHRQEEIGVQPKVPGILLLFTDPNDVRWVRELDGRLVLSERRQAELVESEDDEGAERQVGMLDEANPFAIVCGFIHTVTREDIPASDALRELRKILAPEAKGWEGLDANGISQLRADLAGYNPANHVTYPARRVAYVRLVAVGDPDKLHFVQQGEPLFHPTKVITLILSGDRGWRIFSFGGGGTEPDRILFPKRTL
ncbi:hypothetical protein Kfla_2076 [Kribbella flavida DSM 17836]|uniref:Uncharacterized protein n=1 Tax=Kribbella flavida (strain DSM 17836 / JCM 10339 / NBRC 14399) TaxID=479435 RepID=D2PS34_KRIFD|nr:hypothetical protein [Kribbella flavida]ADB31158.1 hypothetical protein Kfla_2076 [Kribbella flavida DSM 17836]